MSDSIGKYFEIYGEFNEPILEERDIDVIKEMREKYPQINKEFQKIQIEQYSLFCKKMLSYGKNNISMGGNLKNKEDKYLSLTSIWIRCSDKINRLKNLLINKNDNPLDNESIEDSWKDLANYGIIALLVERNKW